MSKLLLKLRVGRGCKRKLRSGTLTEKQAAGVRSVLKDQLGFGLLVDRVADLAAKAGVSEEGDERPFIDWLIKAWPTIQKIIMAIIAALNLL